MGARLQTLVVASLLAAGCAHTGALENGVYQGARSTYQIGPVASGWQRITVSDKSDIAWYSTSAGAVMHVDSKCSPSLDIPLTALRAHLMIGFTDRDILSEETVPMDQREALRTHFTAKLDGVPREVLMQILKKDGCVYDFALIAPPGPQFQQAMGDFDAFVDGFHTISESSS